MHIYFVMILTIFNLHCNSLYFSCTSQNLRCLILTKSIMHEIPNEESMRLASYLCYGLSGYAYLVLIGSGKAPTRHVGFG
jgi:hypothetical protein